MDVAKLREWIKYTRDSEGVNWYLRDVTKTHEYNKIFNLIVYNDHGEVVHTVEYIEPRRGVIPTKFISRIADARELAGINSGFVHQVSQDLKGNPQEIFRLKRQDWLDAGKTEWTGEHNPAKA
ncbi:hypothetical protein [Asticcacaulis sp. W401b]|uniref:hypothetical protein n=1 Tax=Asticcacaulis sp. W401b TaxID=3388666 RepID=UPI0039706B85